MIKRVEHNISRRTRPAVIHIIGEVVEVEEVCKEIIAYSELRICGVRIGHGREESGLQTVEGVTLLSIQIPPLEQPLLRLTSYLFAMTVETKFEVTV